MTHKTQTFAVADPRTFDGTPYEVAQRACLQAEGVRRLLAQAIDGAATMARNSFMERNLVDGDDPKAGDWEDSPQGRSFSKLHHEAKQIENKLSILAQAAGFDPKHPPKE